MINVANFCKAYDDSLAVNDLSFHVEPGQILGLVGPNGAGKTTTLRALTGIIPSSGGTIRIGNFDLADDPLAVKQRTAYVPDDPQLFHDLSVEQHLAFTASAYAVTDATEKIATLLDQFELEFKRHTPASGLSRGMRQKLAICCAYLYSPQALLLDEPMTGLDPPGIRTLKQSIVDRAAQGSAVIISSHLLAMVEDICTHVLVLRGGEKRFFGPVEDLTVAFGSEDPHATLEDAFFRAIDGSDRPHQADSVKHANSNVALSLPAVTCSPTAEV